MPIAPLPGATSSRSTCCHVHARQCFATEHIAGAAHQSYTIKDHAYHVRVHVAEQWKEGRESWHVNVPVMQCADDVQESACEVEQVTRLR